MNFSFEVECQGVARVVIDMRDGADTFTVSEAAVDPFLRDLVVHGGSGNDVLTGRGADVSDGGPGTTRSTAAPARTSSTTRSARRR
jgi:Ca2+-binding RTX toxin-like protein